MYRRTGSFADRQTERETEVDTQMNRRADSLKNRQRGYTNRIIERQTDLQTGQKIDKWVT